MKIRYLVALLYLTCIVSSGVTPFSLIMSFFLGIEIKAISDFHFQRN